MRSQRRLWPTDRQSLLLHAALDPLPRAADAWSAFNQSSYSSDALDPGSARLLPLVWSNLTNQGLNDERLGALAPRYEATREANRHILNELGVVLRGLGAAGIPAIVLKGGALITSVYDDIGVRPLSDVDVLVPLPRVAEAARVLRELGFGPQSPMTPAALRLTHAVSWTQPGRAPVDLHWHVFEECCRAEDDDGLWEGSIPLQVDTAQGRMLALEDLLVHVCAHGEKWVHVPGIRWIADAVAILRHGRLSWERFVDQVVRRQFVLRLHAQLAYLVAEFGAPVPANVLVELDRSRTSRLERFEHRFAVRDRRRPWALVYWCNHVRATGSVVRAAVTFPRYLQAIWRLESLTQLPGSGLARITRRSR